MNDLGVLFFPELGIAIRQFNIQLTSALYYDLSSLGGHIVSNFSAVFPIIKLYKCKC